jgi:hypothetical protein
MNVTPFYAKAMCLVELDTTLNPIRLPEIIILFDVRLTQLWRTKKMLTKIALVTALTLGTAYAAFAAPDTDQKGGYRELGPGGVVTDGINPAYHPSMRGGHGAAGAAYDFAPGSAACARFKSYDPASGTYIGANGVRHTCS